MATVKLSGISNKQDREAIALILFRYGYSVKAVTEKKPGATKAETVIVFEKGG